MRKFMELDHYVSKVYRKRIIYWNNAGPAINCLHTTKNAAAVFET